MGVNMDYAECKLCHNGVLLPFTGPEERIVYFCTNCRARFSGYHEEPTFDGIPIFSQMATYLVSDSLDTGETFSKGELHDSYRSIMDLNPPIQTEPSIPECEYCSRDLLLDCEFMEICWLPSL